MTWDSLVIDDTFELMGGPGGITVDSGPAEGCAFRLSTGYKRGAPAVETTFTQTLQLDGSRPVGSRSGNRSWTLPIYILAPGRIPLQQARDLLLMAVDQETWTLTYTPDGLLPVVFDCFRATVDIDQTTYRQEMAYYCIVELTFESLPFGRSTDPQRIPVYVDTLLQIPSVVIDGFDSIPGAPGSGWYLDGTIRVAGTNSTARWNGGTAARAFAAKDLSACSSIRVYTTKQGDPSPVGYTLALIDANGKPYNLGLRKHRLAGNLKWEPISWTCNWPADFDPSQVTGYYLTVTGGCYLDDLRALPPWSQVFNTPRGAMYSIPGVKGTARTPINLWLNKPTGTAFQQLLVHRPPQNAPKHYTPMIPLDNTVVPNGSTQQAFPPVDGTYGGKRFNGTYTIMANFTTLSSGSRDLTVTIRQAYNDAGVTGSDHATAALTQTFDASQRLVVLGQMTLPLLDAAADNSGTTYTVAVTSTNTADRISEILILDTRGETLYISTARSCTQFYVDEPDTVNDPYDMIGKVLGGSSRALALSVSGEAVMPYRPLSLDPGDNTLLVFNPTEALEFQVTLCPRWRTVRTA